MKVRMLVDLYGDADGDPIAWDLEEPEERNLAGDLMVFRKGEIVEAQRGILHLMLARSNVNGKQYYVGSNKDVEVIHES